MRLSKVFRALLPIPIVMLASCQSWVHEAVRFELARIDREGDPSVMQILRADLARVQMDLIRVEEHLTYCADEVKQLLSEVQKECEKMLVCTSSSSVIEAAVLKYDPSQHGRFLSLMQDRRHQAFYLPAEVRPLSSEDKKHLRDLVSPAWLDDRRRKTRFLIVSHPEGSSPGAQERAKRRSWQFVEEIASIAEEMERSPALAPSSVALLKRGALPARPPEATNQNASASVGAAPQEGAASSRAVRLIREGRILHWVFPFETPHENIRIDDKPRGGDRINRSVWVYRVDC